MHKRPIQEVKEKGNHTVHSALPLSRQLKRSSVMICELSDVSMTSPCSSLTPIRCSLLYLSLHPQNSSCQFMSWQTLRPASKKPHSFFLLFYCPSVKFACSLTTPLPFSHFFPLPLSLSLTPFTDLLPKESATSNCCCCRSLPGWPKPKCFSIGWSKVTWAAAVARPKTGETESVPASSSSSDSKGWCFRACLWVSECVCVCVCVWERERDQGSVLKVSESSSDINHRAASTQCSQADAAALIAALSDRNSRAQINSRLARGHGTIALKGL